MARVRISTTVDKQRLETCRRRLAASDSQVVDRALLALIDELEREAEQAALDAHPYEDDAELAWDAPPGPDLAYDGAVPDEVLRLAEQRRSGAT